MGRIQLAVFLVLATAVCLSRGAQEVGTRQQARPPSAAFPDPLPDTFRFVNHSYSGHRFAGKSVIVFGGSSGIGFAAAAMFRQQCANPLVVVGLNPAKGNLSAVVLNNISVAHCGDKPGTPHDGRAVFLRGDVRQRKSIRTALAALRSTSAQARVDVVVNTAGIGGWSGVGLADIPDDSYLGEHDAVYNNLYGSMAVAAEAMRGWNLSGYVSLMKVVEQYCKPMLGKLMGIAASILTKSLCGTYLHVPNIHSSFPGSEHLNTQVSSDGSHKAVSNTRVHAGLGAPLFRTRDDPLPILCPVLG